jgi:hypothetical protein
MTNLAIVIAVSEYGTEADNLPACKRDGALMASVLEASGKFSEILVISDKTDSAFVKEQISSVIRNYKNKDVNEVLFYFSGHGRFVNDEFYFIMSDYSSRQIKTTSLENSELDSLIRSLKPNLFVKIVDACNSGVNYIKKPDEWENYLKSMDSTFNSLYFMFSSQSDQKSFANSQISFFTESMARSILDHSGSSIRYKDMIDYISDKFSSTKDQTPIFVTQASFTEIFCEISQIMRQQVKDLLEGVPGSHLQHTLPAKELSIVAIIQADSVNYVTKARAHAILEQIPEELKNFTWSHDCGELFTISIKKSSSLPPDISSIGTWLQKNRSTRNFFATPELERQAPDAGDALNPGGASALLHYSALMKSYQQVYGHLSRMSREVATGFKFTAEMPYQSIEIEFSPKLLNITPDCAYICPIVSLSHLRIFWSFCHFRYTDWDSTTKIGKLDWNTAELSLLDEEGIRKQMSRIAADFNKFVEDGLYAKWLPDRPSDSST